ncbi:hypothetical protein BaRGS_00029521 [Batillaria attramentaria]|uniref:Uncharacterized protein n=1 Tax=Batillaria attramentaria TaxID=370345 RepID=A0ABD0JWP0_9CAEN
MRGSPPPPPYDLKRFVFSATCLWPHLPIPDPRDRQLTLTVTSFKASHLTFRSIPQVVLRECLPSVLLSLSEGRRTKLAA